MTRRRSVCGVQALLALGWCGAPALTCAAAVQISDPGAGAYEASLAAGPLGGAVAWYDTRGGIAQLHLRPLDAAGSPSGPEQTLTVSPRAAFEPDLALLEDRSIVAWYDKDATTGALTARLGAWTPEGAPLWQRTLSAPARQGRNAIVRVSGTRLFSAWLQYARGRQPEVWAGWFDRAGQVLMPPRRLATAGRSTWNLNAAIDSSGRAWVIFDAVNRTHRAELFLAILDGSDVQTVRLSEDERHTSAYPDIAIDGDRVAITWFDRRDGNDEVYLYIGSRERLLTRESRTLVNANAVRVTHSAGHSIGAYLAWNGPSLGLAWCDDTSGQYDIWVQRFDVAGSAVSSAQQLTHGAAWSMVPSIVAWQGDFALAWNQYPGGRETQRSAIYLQNLAAVP